MITYLTIRDQTIFGSFISTYSQEIINNASDGAGGTTAIVEYTEAINGDTSYTISNQTEGGTSSNGIGEGGNGNTFGGTTSNCLTLLSSSSSEIGTASNQVTEEDEGTTTYLSEGTTFGSAFTFTTVGGGASSSETSDGSTTALTYSVQWNITENATATGIRNITSNVDTTTSRWTITSESGRSWATTESLSTTAVSNQSAQTFDLGGGTTITENANITESFESSYITTAMTSGTFNVSQEMGTVVLAENNDWLWSIKTSELDTFNTNVSLLTDIAASFTEATFWPVWNTQVVSFAGNTVLNSYTVTQAATSYSWEYLTITDTSTLTLTSGDYLPRDTYTTTCPVWDTSSSSFSMDSSTMEQDAASSAVGTSLTQLTTNTATHVTYPVGLSDIATVSLNSTTTLQTTTTYMSILNGYVSAIDSEGDEFGANVGQTTLLQDFLFLGNLTDAASIYEPIPAVGAFLAPQQLKSDSNSDFGGNLDFGDGQTVYFPFSSGGVFPNVSVPYYFNGAISTTASGEGTDILTYRYSWETNTEGATLLYSKISTFEDGTTTATTGTFSSGTFNTSSDVETRFISQPSVFGGYAYNEAPETAYYPARAVYGTHIDGSSTSTFASVFMSSESATKQGDLVIEVTAAAFCAWQGTLGNGAAPYLAYARNDE